MTTPKPLSWAAAAIAGAGLAGALQAQEAEPLEVGAAAPAFTLAGGNAEGLLPDSVSLSDFQGKTVVLAFFFKARTGG